MALACSRKKNTFINRNWHAVTAEYNTLYNGNLALEQGKEEINLNYADNYWDILPVERLSIDEQILLPDSIRNQNFGRAEVKAVKAIQKHSMQIKGKEQNPQMDEAYLLLGKARYFDQRFIPALDAFNYILYRYPASDNITHARIWRAKTNIRLENEVLAIENLKKILESNRLKDQDIADANAAMAQAYINRNHLDSARTAITTAAEFTREDDEKGRYFYILGQLNNKLGEKGRANAAFDEVIALNRKSPRIYLVNAHVQKARNFEYGEGSNYRLREILAQLEEDRENRPYLDKIYFQIGEYYYRIDSTKRAVEYYNKSLRAPSSDVYLKSINYEILANINFDNSNYRQAGSYFDSTLTYMSPDLLEFRTIKKKRENLDDVIRYQNIADLNDSILYVSGLSEAERLTYFTRYTDSLKTIARKQMEAGEIELIGGAQPAVRSFPVAPGVPAAGPNNTNANIFYFYNPLRVSRGAQDFLRVWGSRELADNWRLGSGSFNQNNIEAQEKVIQVNLDNDPRYDPQTYINRLPGTPNILDSLATQRNLAYYQLGVIYSENYKEYGLAQQRLESLLQSEPEDRLILPAKYNLYKIYEATRQTQKQEELKADILQNYPDSRYAAFILNPEDIQKDTNGPDGVYLNLYKKYENQEYAQVIEESRMYSSEFSGDPIVPKFELLKAMATGRLLGLEAYKAALNEVALNYPQTEEGKKAQNIINNTIPAIQALEFKKDSIPGEVKLVYTFKNAENATPQELKEVIDRAIQDLNYSRLRASVDVYTNNEIFVVVHGLQNPSKAMGFEELLQTNKDYKISREAFVISSENYRILQIKKNLRTYAELN